MEGTPGQLYEERLKRFNDAVALRRPDRVPIATFTHYFITRYSGLTNRAAWYEPEKMAAALVKAATDFRGIWRRTCPPSCRPGVPWRPSGLAT